MRKKLREIMDKEEGFTLVELLAVIVILAIIVAIAVPGIGKVIDNSRGKAKKAETELVKDAVRIYYTAEDDATGPVTITELSTNGYLDKGDDSELNDDASITYDVKTGEITIPNDLFKTD